MQRVCSQRCCLLHSGCQSAIKSASSSRVRSSPAVKANVKRTASPYISNCQHSLRWFRWPSGEQPAAHVDLGYTDIQASMCLIFSCYEPECVHVNCVSRQRPDFLLRERVEVLSRLYFRAKIVSASSSQESIDAWPLNYRQNTMQLGDTILTISESVGIHKSPPTIEVITPPYDMDYQ